MARFVRAAAAQTVFLPKLNCSRFLMSAKQGTNHIEIVEGTARMLYDEREAVFYNKVQVLNRDLSIQVIKLFSEMIGEERAERYKAKKLKYDKNPSHFDKPPHELETGIVILDALAATGLRSVRYMKEIPLLRKIVINDLSTEATSVAQQNISTNNVDPELATVHNKDACILMYEHREAIKNFDVIDLDPYGSASPFLDAAVQAVAGDGGLLCVTCTDAPVLCGNYAEVCFAKYGSMPLKAKYAHEMSLRILLNAIESAANKYKRHIVPWLSLSVDFYVRVFVRVYESPAEVKNTCLKRMMVYQSSQCPSFHIQPVGTRKMSRRERRDIAQGGADSKNSEEQDSNSNTGAFSAYSLSIPPVCEETGARWKVGGPFWGAPIHDQNVVDKILKRVENYRNMSSSNSKDCIPPIQTADRMVGILTSISEELKDVPLYYILPELSSTVHCSTITHNDFKSALINAGYRASHFHHEPTAFKTDAPPTVVWDIIRAHCKDNMPTGSKHKQLSDAAKKILSNPCKIVADFRRPKVLNVNKKHVARFAPNPEPFWGPKRRAGKLENVQSCKQSNEVHVANPNEDMENMACDAEPKTKKPKF